MKCYGLWQRNKTPFQKGINKPDRFCTEPDCNNKHQAKNLCLLHYRRKFMYHKVKKLKKIKIIKPKKLNCVCEFCKISFFTKHKKRAKFCSKKCFFTSIKKDFILKKGYKKILLPLHHRADKKGYVFEHIVIMEQKLNRKIITPETIHHIDKNKKNNSIENLMLFKNNSDHLKYHKILDHNPINPTFA